MKVGVDTGGTFTDVVADDGRIAKVLSTPDDPARAVASGVGRLMPADGGPAVDDGLVQQPEVPGRDHDAGAGHRRAEPPLATAEEGEAGLPELLAHGTTVATNALLERRGAAVALVSTTGLGDVIEIARQDRPSLYDQLADRPSPLVPRALRYEVGGRLAADGTELAPVEAASVPVIDPAAEAVAVCLLHADLNADHERAVAAVLSERGHDVSCSHEVSPEMREYERTVTTVINASLRPRTRHYLRRLDDLADEVLVMTSAGGLLPAAGAAELPAALLLSGPAGGVRAGAAVAAANGFPDAITFDMGGTSTDVCLILDGQPAPAAQREVGGFTVRFPSLDVHTIGAGGGSIARIDAGGALVVGPQSAGADPGPACYGRGGTAPTVTDANLAAGRIPDDVAFGGLRLDRAAATQALADAGVTAEGVLAVVDANMERALRAVSVERGVDPRGLALVAFGGAGPLHAAALAEALGMAAVVIPARAGVLSAVGLLTAPRRRDLVRSWPDPADHTGLTEALATLAEEAAALVADPAAAAGEPGGARPENAPADQAAADAAALVRDTAADPAVAAGEPGGTRPESGDADQAAADVASDADPAVAGPGRTRPGGANPYRAAVDAAALVRGAGADPAAGVPGGSRRGNVTTDQAAVGAAAGARARAGGIPAGTGGAEPGVVGGLARGDVVVETAVDCRYRGQSHELTVASVGAFPAEHERRNGYAPQDQPVEVVALRATATRAAAVELDALPPVPPRIAGARRGPAVLAEPDCTVWIPEGWVAEPGAAGALVLRRVGSAGAEAGSTRRGASEDRVAAVATTGVGRAAGRAVAGDDGAARGGGVR